MKAMFIVSIINAYPGKEVEVTGILPVADIPVSHCKVVISSGAGAKTGKRFDAYIFNQFDGVIG